MSWSPGRPSLTASVLLPKECLLSGMASPSSVALSPILRRLNPGSKAVFLILNGLLSVAGAGAAAAVDDVDADADAENLRRFTEPVPSCLFLDIKAEEEFVAGRFLVEDDEDVVGAGSFFFNDPWSCFQLPDRLFRSIPRNRVMLSEGGLENNCLKEVRSVNFFIWCALRRCRWYILRGRLELGTRFANTANRVSLLFSTERIYRRTTSLHSTAHLIIPTMNGSQCTVMYSTFLQEYGYEGEHQKQRFATFHQLPTSVCKR